MKEKYLVDEIYMSYNKLCSKQVKDVYGYITNEFEELVFQICKVVFEDGSTHDVEGEHDLPYTLNPDEKVAFIMEEIFEEEEMEE